MGGAPVAEWLGRGSTAAVASLVRDSALPRSSVNETVTLMVLPSSLSARVWLELVAPSISASSASHLVVVGNVVEAVGVGDGAGIRG